jgi:hypothetical protein
MPTTSNKLVLFQFSAFITASIAMVLILWGNRFLPMVDLPQYSGTVHVIRYFDALQSNYSELYRLNVFSPYILSTFLAVALSHLSSVFVATKLVVTISALLLPLSLAYLLKKSGGPLCLALLGFPLAFNFSFGWGLISYLFALPLAVFSCAQAIDYTRSHTRKSLFVTAVFLCLTFCSHVFPGAVALAIVSTLLLCDKSIGKKRFLTLVPPALITIVVCSYLSSTPFNSVIPGLTWNLFSLDHAILHPWILASETMSWEATTIGVAILLFPLAISGKLTLTLGRLIPFLGILLFVSFGPQAIQWLGFLQERMIPFLPITTLLLVSKSESKLRELIGCLLFVGILCFSFFFHGMRIHGFNDETKGFDEVLAQMEPDKKVLYFTIDRVSHNTHEASFLHFTAWYQTFKGGVLGYSFAHYPNWPIQYRHGFPPSEINRIWYPEAFDWNEDSHYDYYFVKSEVDPAPIVFKERSTDVLEIAHADGWWLYKPNHRRAS